MNIALIKNNKVDNIIVIDENTDGAYFASLMSDYQAFVNAEGLNIGDDYPKVN
jgi:hypothetical protein